MIIGKLCIQYPVRLKRFTGDLKTNKHAKVQRPERKWIKKSSQCWNKNVEKLQKGARRTIVHQEHLITKPGFLEAKYTEMRGGAGLSHNTSAFWSKCKTKPDF